MSKFRISWYYFGRGVLCAIRVDINSSRDVSHWFFSLDVEGAELKVIKTIPLDKVKINLFFIKYVVWNVSTDAAARQKRLEEFREFFKKVGRYKEIKKSDLDVVFART